MKQHLLSAATDLARTAAERGAVVTIESKCMDIFIIGSSFLWANSAVRVAQGARVHVVTVQAPEGQKP